MPEIMDDYLQCLKKYPSLAPHTTQDVVDKISIGHILTAEQISGFIQDTACYSACEGYPPITGIFVTKLIQNSYTAGLDGFYITTGRIVMPFLGFGLKAEKEIPLEIRVDGPVGDWCFASAENLKAEIFSAGRHLGSCAKHSSFVIRGLIKSGAGWNAEGCIFKTNNRKALNVLKRNVAYCMDNEIYLAWDGKENRIRRLVDRFPFLEHYI